MKTYRKISCSVCTSLIGIAFAIGSPVQAAVVVVGDDANIGRGHTVSGTFASVTAGETNKATATRSIIGGGFLNQSLGEDSFIGGGRENIVTNFYGVIG